MADSPLSTSTCVTQSVNFHQDAMDGGKMDAGEAAMLETALEEMPMDLASRTKLLGYYFSNDLVKGEAIYKRRTHVLWVIRNLPDSELAGLPYCGIHKEIDPDGYAEAKKLWLERIESHPKNPKLLYNDYSMTANGKRNAVVKMIGELKQKGVRVDGVGMQGHWSLNEPTIEEIEASIVAFAKAGVDVHITELDIDVLPRKSGMFGADVAMKLAQDPAMDPYRDGLPEDMQESLAQRYADIFRLFLKHREKIKRVTFWGTTDKHSWLNNWPIKGRTSHPLLFDRNGNPKLAFHAVIGLKDTTRNKSSDTVRNPE